MDGNTAPKSQSKAFASLRCGLLAFLLVANASLAGSKATHDPCDHDTMETDNPIAVTEGRWTQSSDTSPVSPSCLDVRLQLYDFRERTQVHGVLVLENRCEEDLVFLSAPIETRVSSAANELFEDVFPYEKMLQTVYAILYIYPQNKTARDIFFPGDFSKEVRVLPEYVCVPSGDTRVIALRATSGGIYELSPGNYKAFLESVIATHHCTESQKTIVLSRTIEQLAREKRVECDKFYLKAGVNWVQSNEEDFQVLPADERQ